MARLISKRLYTAAGNHRVLAAQHRLGLPGHHDFNEDGKIHVHIFGSSKFSLQDKQFLVRGHNFLQNDGENVTPMDKAWEFHEAAVRLGIRGKGTYSDQKRALRDAVQGRAYPTPHVTHALSTHIRLSSPKL